MSLQTKARRRCTLLVYRLVKRDIPPFCKLCQPRFHGERLGQWVTLCNAINPSQQILDAFISVLSHNVRNSITSTAQTCGSFGLLCDESTATSVLEQLVTNIRACQKGQSQTHFLSMKDLPNGKADAITTALEDVVCFVWPTQWQAFVIW